MIGVIDYGIGNLRSAEKALLHLGANARLIDAPNDLDGVTAVVLPGVGAYGRCVDALDAAGFRAPLLELFDAQVPFLGICVGFQLLYAGSAESPGAKGLGYFDGIVTSLPRDVKVPQMQWNTLQSTTNGPGPLFDDLPDDPWVYFVHSYAPPVGPETIVTCEYGTTVAAGASRGSVSGVQFHPEKSGEIGLKILANFTKQVQR